MRCPECSGDSKVKDGRLNDKNIFRRRRECLDCGYKWTTYEIDLVDLDALDEFKELADLVLDFVEENELKSWEKKSLLRIARFFNEYEDNFNKISEKIHYKKRIHRCAIKGCDNYIKGRGLCRNHYAQVSRKNKKLQNQTVGGDK